MLVSAVWRLVLMLGKICFAVQLSDLCVMQDLQGGLFRCFLLDGHGQAGNSSKSYMHCQLVTVQLKACCDIIMTDACVCLMSLCQCFHQQLMRFGQLTFDLWH